jgi:hypothetical protein
VLRRIIVKVRVVVRIVNSSAGVIAAVLTSSIVVLTGLTALVRAIWRVSMTLRDNTAATGQLSVAFGKFSDNAELTLTNHEQRITRIEDRADALHDDVRAGRRGVDSSNRSSEER